MEENRILRNLGIERHQRDYVHDNYPYGPANDSLLGYMAPQVAMPFLTMKSKDGIDPNYIPQVGEMFVDPDNGDVYLGDGKSKIDYCPKIYDSNEPYIYDARFNSDTNSLDFTFKNGDTTSVSMRDVILYRNEEL